MPLLERDDHLAALRQYGEEARAGDGRLVLMCGEAGVGKSALLDALETETRDVRWATGACDGMFTPRPLGPLFDLAQSLEGELLDSCRAGAGRDELFTTLLRQIGAVERLTVLAIEDVHWADEATLDLIRFLGRRIRALPCLLIVTYRDDALAADDALRVVLGGLATNRSTRRMTLPRLSEDAVAQLSEGSSVEPQQLYRLTSGNPFFVTEVLRWPSADVPESARDTVLARVAGVSPSAHRTLEVAVLLGGRVDLALLDAVDRPTADLDELIGAGLLVSDANGVRFRHEIVRLAVDGQMPVFRKAALHSELLAVLQRSENADAAVLAYHAEGAGDSEALFGYATLAGHRAAEMGAHREAAAHYATALRCGDGAAAYLAADLHQRLATEATLVNQWRAAAEAGQRASVLWHGVADVLREGEALRVQSATAWRVARGTDSLALAEAAVDTLRPLGSTAELATAYGNLASLRMLHGQHDAAREALDHAHDLAKMLDLPGVHSDAEITEAYLAWLAGRPWKNRMRRALSDALEVDALEQAARAYANLHAMLTTGLDFAEADSCYLDAEKFCADNDIVTFGLCLRASYAASLSLRGRWDEAVTACREVLRAEPSPFNRLEPTLVVGRVLARRSEVEARSLLDDAVQIADATGRPGLIADAHAARAEAHWLSGDSTAAAADIDIGARTAGSTDPSMRRRLATWQRRLDMPVTVGPAGAPDPHARAQGKVSLGAAQLWTEHGVPYEAALALFDGGSDDDLREALRRFDALGAVATARLTRQRMRARGMRAIPSGPQPATRAHQAGLTRREREVLALICLGETNREISRDLVVSPRTVDHHVSSLLDKLRVHSRAEAAQRAVQLGLVDDPRARPVQGSR
jgi:DNA-binding CsgD family transcriptional regulator